MLEAECSTWGVKSGFGIRNMSVQNECVRARKVGGYSPVARTGAQWVRAPLWSTCVYAAPLHGCVGHPCRVFCKFSVWRGCFKDGPPRSAHVSNHPATGADPIIRDFDCKRLTYTFSAVTVTNAA